MARDGGIFLLRGWLTFPPPTRRAVLRGQRQRDLSLWTPFSRCGGDWRGKIVRSRFFGPPQRRRAERAAMAYFCRYQGISFGQSRALSVSASLPSSLLYKAASYFGIRKKPRCDPRLFFVLQTFDRRRFMPKSAGVQALSLPLRQGRSSPRPQAGTAAHRSAGFPSASGR